MLCFIYLKVEHVIYWTYNIMYNNFKYYIKHLYYVIFIIDDLYMHNFY
jgi:hypothetical protein